jgi:hypothetical protein
MTNSPGTPVDLTMHPGVRSWDRPMRLSMATLALGFAFIVWKQMALQDAVRDLQMRADDELCLQRHRPVQRFAGHVHPVVGSSRPRSAGS